VTQSVDIDGALLCVCVCVCVDSASGPEACPVLQSAVPAVRSDCPGSASMLSARAPCVVSRHRRPPCTASSAAAATPGYDSTDQRRPTR